MLREEAWGAEPRNFGRYLDLFQTFSHTFILELILRVANDFCFSYKSTSCGSLGKALKVAYCDNSEHNWDTLSHPACVCFGYSADTLTFQLINPKETLISSFMLLLAVMIFLQQVSASVKTNEVCIMGWQGSICADKQLHLSCFKHSCLDLLSLKFNLGCFGFFLWTSFVRGLVKILHHHFRNGAAVLF